MINTLSEDTLIENNEKLESPGIVSTTPAVVKGDWVLFHPVYTPEELRAVKVRDISSKSIQT